MNNLVCDFDKYYFNNNGQSSCINGSCDNLSQIGLNYSCVDKNYSPFVNVNSNTSALCIPFGRDTPYCTENQIVLDNVCAPTQPTMTDTSKLQCCLATVDPLQGGPGNTPVCAQGWCPNSQKCVDYMNSYCLQGNNPDSNCELYIRENQSVKTQFTSSILNQLTSQSNVLNSTNNAYIYKFCSDRTLSDSKVCDQILDNYCATIIRRNDIQVPSSSLKVCGCHLNESIYSFSKFVDKDLPDVCDPLCLYPNTLQRSDTQCDGTVCILDLNLIDSAIKGNLTIENICQSKGGTSRCYFSDQTLDVINNLSSDQLKVKTTCDACFSYKQNDPRSITPIECPPKKSASTFPTTAIVIGSIVVVLGVILLFSLFFI